MVHPAYGCNVTSHCSCEQQCHLVTLCAFFCQFDFEHDQRQQLVLMPQVEQAILIIAQIQVFFFSSVIYWNGTLRGALDY